MCLHDWRSVWISQWWHGPRGRRISSSVWPQRNRKFDNFRKCLLRFWLAMPCRWGLRRSKQLSMAASIQYFIVRFEGKARYQRCHSAHFSGFKLATSTFMLSILVDITGLLKCQNLEREIDSFRYSVRKSESFAFLMVQRWETSAMKIKGVPLEGCEDRNFQQYSLNLSSILKSSTWMLMELLIYIYTY